MTDNTDDDFYDDPATMGDDTSAKIAAPDDADEADSKPELTTTPLVPERDKYDLKNRGTLDEVEDGSHETGGEDHDTKEDSYDPSNDLEANIQTPDEADDSR